MALGPVRPRFTMSLPKSTAHHVAALESATSEQDSGCEIRVLGDHVDVRVVEEDRHRWSPCVQLEFESGEDGTLVRGLIGPNPNVWTMFAFINIAILLGAILGLIFGLAQLFIDQHPSALWSLPVAALLFGVTYAVSQVGQRCAAEQTRHLMSVVENTLGHRPMGVET